MGEVRDAPPPFLGLFLYSVHRFAPSTAAANVEAVCVLHSKGIVEPKRQRTASMNSNKWAPGWMALILFYATSIWGASSFDLPDTIADSTAQIIVRYALATRAEGPAVGADGSVYYSEMSTNSVMKLAPHASEPNVVLQAPGVNGTLLYNDTTLLVAAGDKILRLNLQTKKHTNFISNYNGHSPTGSNDLCRTPEGGIFFTTPSWENWPVGHGEIFYVSPDGDLFEVARDLRAPNGIKYCTRQQRLYVCESLGNRVIYFTTSDRYTKLSEPTEFIAAINEPDGIALDQSGTVYVASFKDAQIQVVDASGMSLGHIQLSSKHVTNCAFGWGEHAQLLVITGLDAIYQLSLAR